MSNQASVFRWISVLIVLWACDSGPKVITPQGEGQRNEERTGIFSDVAEAHNHDHADHAGNPHLHSVVVEEVLQASRYVYLHVKGSGKKFWIATNKMEVEKGETYLFQEALLKTQFESKEHSRIFDTIYLVAHIVKDDKGVSTSDKDDRIEPAESGMAKESGSVKIAEIVGNPKNFDGKTVQIHGTCVKVNRNIMGRNWIHIQDGSKDDFDLVITSQQSVPKGHVITMRGKVALNKDFGANYKYDIILEEGEVIRQ